MRPWIGGTVDATGAVVAAGAILGAQAEQIAAIVKMIQNTLIGVVAFLVAVFWVTRVEAVGERKPDTMEIWYRLPKFIIGFVAASLVFSFVLTPSLGEARVAEVLDLTSDVRGWLFCLAFLSIGLESSLRELARHTTGGRPIQLYVTGQAFNVVLTLAGRLARLRRHPVRQGRRRGDDCSRRGPASHRDRAQPGDRPRRHAALLHGSRRLAGLPGRPATDALTEGGPLSAHGADSPPR